MEALMAWYGDTSSSDSEPDSDPSSSSSSVAPPISLLPPPPVHLLTPPNFTDISNYFQSEQTSRIRSFPHIEGNYALHIYIPVHIPPAPKKLEQVALGREFHISLGRTVPIRVHQFDSLVAMLRQKLQTYKRYWIDFNEWEVFVNDDYTRSFLSVEVTAGGLPEITKQIQVVNEVYKLHNLPEFYKDPRPHISIAWECGDISESLKAAVEEAKRCSSLGGCGKKHMFTCKFGGIDCKIGNKTFTICKSPE